MVGLGWLGVHGGHEVGVVTGIMGFTGIMVVTVVRVEVIVVVGRVVVVVYCPPWDLKSPPPMGGTTLGCPPCPPLSLSHHSCPTLPAPSPLSPWERGVEEPPGWHLVPGHVLPRTSPIGVGVTQRQFPVTRSAINSLLTFSFPGFGVFSLRFASWLHPHPASS